MAKNDYHFVTEWSFEASVEEVASILQDIESLARWWPTVYLRVTVMEPGDERGVGRKVDLLTKGYLPYRLRWQFEVVESNPPHGFSILARGDLHGTGTWTLRQEGPKTLVTYDWRVRADKPLLQTLSGLLKPVFSWNHRWAMEQGDKSLRAELLRRRAHPL